MFSYQARWYWGDFIACSQRFKEAGGRVLQRKVDRLEDLFEDFNIVVNCSGIGANKLGDSSVHPIRGQVFRVGVKMKLPISILLLGEEITFYVISSWFSFKILYNILFVLIILNV